jgi:uncharacterized membrane protein YhaH (DUF805 family)
MVDRAMRKIIAAILYNFRNLARFSGRDTRAQFWPYTLFLFIVQTIVMMIIIIPMMYRMMTIPFEFLHQHPPTVNETLNPVELKGFVQTRIHEVLADTLPIAMIIGSIMTVVFVLLIAAAVTRRLHDRGKSGYWGLAPVPFAAFSIVAAPASFSRNLARGYDSSRLLDAWDLLRIATTLNGLVYWAALILLIVLLAQRSSPGPNGYGPDTQVSRGSPTGYSI